MPGKKPSTMDSSRGLALLWGTQMQPSRSGLTIRAIVEAATELADESGMEALSMRTVAQRLGVGTMSLYTHIPGRTELLDLMVDASYSEMYASDDAALRLTQDWRSGLSYIAQENWDLYRRHPWMLEIVGGRPTLGPNATRKYERELTSLDGIGLSDIQMDAALTLLLTWIHGLAQIKAQQSGEFDQSGISEAEWWVTNAPLLPQFLDPARFPLATRVGAAAGATHEASASPDYLRELGLQFLLDGIQVLIGPPDA